MTKFKHHKYVYTFPFGSHSHRWEVIGPDGAMHFHVSVRTEEPHPFESAGLETHSRTPLYEPSAPDHIDCPLTGGPCWHDGTSLYATETLWPRIKVYLAGGAHSKVFRILEREYDERFADPVED